MRALIFDISLHAGYAVLEGDVQPAQDGTLVSVLAERKLPVLIDSGNVVPTIPLQDLLDQHGYPDAYVAAAYDMAGLFMTLIQKWNPDVIVVEETNLGKQRYSQKVLEFLHCEFNRQRLGIGRFTKPGLPGVVYISTSAWRHTLGPLGFAMTKEDKRNNAKLSKAKRNAAVFGGKVDKKKLGVKGRIGTKHQAVRFVNAHYGQALKMKDNDIADAICLGVAYFNNAVVCDGRTDR